MACYKLMLAYYLTTKLVFQFYKVKFFLHFSINKSQPFILEFKESHLKDTERSEEKVLFFKMLIIFYILYSGY